MGRRGGPIHRSAGLSTMRSLVALLLPIVLLVGGCDGGPIKTEDKSKRPVGMSEEIWKIYGGAESGVMEDKPKDAPQDTPAQEKK